MKQGTIARSINASSKCIEAKGIKVSIKDLSKLVEYAGGKITDRKKYGCTYKIPVEGACVIRLSKGRGWVNLYLGREKEDGTVDASPSTRIKMIDSHGEAALKQLAKLKRGLDLVTLPNTMQMYMKVTRKKTIKNKT